MLKLRLYLASCDKTIAFQYTTVYRVPEQNGDIPAQTVPSVVLNYKSGMGAGKEEGDYDWKGSGD